MKAARSAALSGLLLALAAPTSGQETFTVVETGILELQRALASGDLTSVELVEAYVARIRAYDQDGPRLNAIIRLNPRALAEAEALDRERAEHGPRGPLHGIPVLMKDNYDVEGMATSAGSLGLATLVPPDDAFQVRKLRNAGAIILGKTNLHELAAGITTISSFGGQTRNPYDPTRNPGGSSGGTGAAIAASFAAVGWGSDTCGSIRIPSSFQALFGLRPTKGLSSIDGIVPLSHTQDTGGPLARTVTDLAIALDATIGADPADPATRALADAPVVSFTERLEPDALRGKRIGVLGQRFGRRSDEREISAIVSGALDAMGELGADIVQVEMPGLDSLLDSSGLIRHEFKFDLADYLAATPGAPVVSLREIIDRGLHHQELDERFRDRDLPTARETEEYRAALAERVELRRLLIEALDEHNLDALAYPTVRREIAPIGVPQEGSSCQLSAHSGLPALSVPAGFTADGMPVGTELLGRPFHDAELVALAFAYEQAVSPRRPPTTTPDLIDGRAPAPVVLRVEPVTDPGAGSVAVESRFRFDPITGTLEFDVVVSGAPAEDMVAIVLGRGSAEADGPVLHRLAGPGRPEAQGILSLPGLTQAVLRDGGLYLRVFTGQQPHGAFRARILMD